MELTLLLARSVSMVLMVAAAQKHLLGLRPIPLHLRLFAFCSGLAWINPFVAPRALVGAVLISIAVSRFAEDGNGRRLFFVALVVGLLFSAPTDFSRLEVGDSNSSGLVSLEDGDFSHLQQVANSEIFVQENGHTVGLQSVGAAFGLVPRSIWPSKPLDTGQIIQGPRSDINPSAPFWAEAYVDFGFLGVAIYFFLLAAIVRVVDDEARQSSILATLALGSLLLLLRGSFQSYIALMMPVYFFAAVLSKPRNLA